MLTERATSAAGRALATITVALGLVSSGVPPAQATIFSGSCPVQVDFSFGSRVRSASFLTAPDYSVTISNYLGLPCAVAPELAQPLRSTNGGGTGSSIIWTCESTVARGSWSQGWGSGFPAVTSGSHAIGGSWGAWTMVVTSSSLNFAGVIELTVNPFEPATKLLQCEQGGIKNLSMVGTMVFQDPELPAA